MFVSDKERLFNREETALYLSVKVQTLANWATTGRFNLSFIKVGRAVRYRKSDLDKWLESRTIGAIK